MAENTGVTSADAAKPPEVNPNQPPAVDQAGVPWMNRAKELERKLGDLSEKFEAVTRNLSEAVGGGFVPRGTPTEEDIRKEQIAAFANNPNAYISNKIEERLVQSEALEAMAWLKSQEGWKPEYEQEVYKVIRDEGLMSRPLKRAQTAWKLLTQEHPDFKSKQAEARERELKKYQVEGVGRRVEEPPTKEEEELRKKFADPKLTLREQADVLNRLSVVRRERLDRLNG